MTHEFKILTEAEMMQFESERQSDFVIQSKCPKCGAWYETAKKATGFTERFACDCGHLFQIEVPPAPAKLIQEPTNVDLMAIGDQSDRLDTGMTVKEAMERARIWWAKTGSREMQLHQKRQAKPVGNGKGNGVAFTSSMDPNDPNGLPSGILHGKPWDELTKREKIQIVKVWHHFNVRNPDKLDADITEEFKFHQRGRIN